jgi:hypothetical protein
MIHYVAEIVTGIDRITSPKDLLKKRIEALSDESVSELIRFMDYLEYREKQPGGTSSWFRELYDLFAPVREDVRASGLTEDEVNALIRTAISEVREGEVD